MSVKQPQPATAIQALGLLRHRFMATRVASIMLIALLASCGDGRVDVLTGEGAHIQLRVSPSAVAPGVRALGRLPGLHKGVRGAAPRGSSESQEPPQGL
jgi:hypothetical protein